MENDLWISWELTTTISGTEIRVKSKYKDSDVNDDLRTRYSGMRKMCC
jgi:hypothetical protein